MGDGLKFYFVFNYSLDFSDYIEIFGIVVNSFLAIWIVKTIQSKLTNKRVLKDHFISEIIELRIDYNSYIKDCFDKKVLPKDIPRKFKLIHTKKTHLMKDVMELYKISCPDLDIYHDELREIITNSSEYNANYRSNTPVAFTHNTKRQIELIQSTHYGLFNKLIRFVNDSN